MVFVVLGRGGSRLDGRMVIYRGMKMGREIENSKRNDDWEEDIKIARGKAAMTEGLL